MSNPRSGYQVVFKPGSFGFKFPGAHMPGLDLERALIDFILVKGLATNPSGDCCTLVPVTGEGEPVPSFSGNGLSGDGTELDPFVLGGTLTENTVIDGGTDFSFTMNDLTNASLNVSGASADSQLFLSGTLASPTRITHTDGADASKVSQLQLDVDNLTKLVYTDASGDVGFYILNDPTGVNSNIRILTNNVKDGDVATRQFLRVNSINGTSEFENMTIAPNRQTGSYVLVLSDVDKIVEMNVGIGNTLTVPTNASVAFPIGTHIKVIQYGAGVVTITPAGGVTINSQGGLLATNGQFAVVELIKTTTDEWHLYGDRA